MMNSIIQRLIKQAKGSEFADFVLKNCQVVNVFTRELIRADVAICDEWIAGVGTYSGVREMDCY
jgi:adenine deaminase